MGQNQSDYSEKNLQSFGKNSKEEVDTLVSEYMKKWILNELNKKQQIQIKTE